MSGIMQNEGERLREESGPGKFEGEPRITRFLWDLMLETGPDEETGSSTEGPFWAGLLKGPLAAGIQEKLSPPEREFLDRQAGAILTEGTTGFVYGNYYKSRKELEKAWNYAVEETAESEEEEGEVEENPISKAKTKREELYEDLFVAAIERGSRYWYNFPDLSMVPEGPDPMSIRIFRAVMSGAKVPVSGVDSGVLLLGHVTKASVKNALALMERGDYYESRGRILSGDWGTRDADVWFQFVVMGDKIYGFF